MPNTMHYTPYNAVLLCNDPVELYLHISAMQIIGSQDPCIDSVDCVLRGTFIMETDVFSYFEVCRPSTSPICFEPSAQHVRSWR